MAEPQEATVPVYKAFVANIPFPWGDSDLLAAFEAFDPIAATVVYHGRRSMGYGFVDFSNAEQLQKAIEGMDGKEESGRNLAVQVAREKIERPKPKQENEAEEGETSGARRGRRRPRAPRRREPEGERPPRVVFPPETTAFVSNLAFSVDDEELAALFTGLQVTSTHVARMSRGRSKGFGFVQFATAADRQRAIDEFNLRLLHEREITIAPARAKQEDAAE